ACPAWITVEGEGKAARYVLVPERADVVRRVFRMTAAGQGSRAVIKTLVAEKVPPFEGQTLTDEEREAHRRERAKREVPVDALEEKALWGKGRWYSGPDLDEKRRKVRHWRPCAWNLSYLKVLLASRAAFGEFTPRTGRGSSAKRKPDGSPIADYY